MRFPILLAAILAAIGLASSASPQPAPPTAPPAVTTPTPSTPQPPQTPGTPDAPSTPSQPNNGVVKPQHPQTDSSLVIGQDKTAVWQFCTTNSDTGEVFAWLRAYGTAPATGNYTITAVPLDPSIKSTTLIKNQPYTKDAPVFAYTQLANKQQYNIHITAPGQTEPIIYRLPVDCRQ